MMSLMYGRIDEAEIHSRALDASEILAIFEAGRAGKCKPTPACAPSPPGLISWWRGEGNADDSAGASDGTPSGTSFVAGEVGQAFDFDGVDSGVALGNPPSLQLQTFTIEAWIKRADSLVASLDESAGPGGLIFSYGQAGYGYGLFDDGRLVLSHIGFGSVDSGALSVTDTSAFHHVAVTKSGSTVAFYLDGIEAAAPPYDPGFEFATNAAIGARDDISTNSFYGAIDEVTVYNRALTAAEIQGIFDAGSAGKCSAKNCPPLPQFCRPAEKSILLIKDSSDDAKDKLVRKWIKGEPTSQAELADPTTGADYSLCLYAGSTSALIGEARVPAGSNGWAVKSDQGYKYKDAAGAHAGIQKIVLKGSAEAKAKAVVKGKGPYLPELAASIPLTPPVIAQLLNAESRMCWGAEYDGAEVLKNEKGKFKGKR